MYGAIGGERRRRNQKSAISEKQISKWRRWRKWRKLAAKANENENGGRLNGVANVNRRLKAEVAALIEISKSSAAIEEC